MERSRRQLWSCLGHISSVWLITTFETNLLKDKLQVRLRVFCSNHARLENGTPKKLHVLRQNEMQRKNFYQQLRCTMMCSTIALNSYLSGKSNIYDRKMKLVTSYSDLIIHFPSCGKWIMRTTQLIRFATTVGAMKSRCPRYKHENVTFRGVMCWMWSSWPFSPKAQSLQ